MTGPVNPRKYSTLLTGTLSRAACILGIAMLLMLALPVAAQAPPTPIPTQIATAKRAFLSNAGESDPATLNHDYSALYAALRSWGKYELTATPAEADLVLEMHYIQVFSGLGNCSEVDNLVVHILDRPTRTVLWSITVNGTGGKEKASARAAVDILNALKPLAEPNATASDSPQPPATKTRFSDEKK